MAWCRTALWIWSLAAMYEICCSSPTSFSNSLSLTRSIHFRVQKLLFRYKEEQFGDTQFDDRRIVLNTLPTVTINYRTWLQMEDIERLNCASRDLQSFWTHLESQRQKLQESGIQTGVSAAKKRHRRGRLYKSLPQSILAIQLDLRDLMRQVHSQLLSISTLKKKKDDYTHTPPFSRLINPTTSSSLTSSIPSTSTPTASPPATTRSLQDLILSSSLGTTSILSVTQGEPSSVMVQQDTPKSVSSRWVSILEGYVILRDLEQYLSRLVRDYTLLQAKS